MPGSVCDRVAPELAKLPYRIETDQYGRILAERYCRAMFHGRDESWNLPDTHMFETLNELSAACGGDWALRNGFAPGEKLDADDTRQIHFKSFSECFGLPQTSILTKNVTFCSCP